MRILLVEDEPDLRGSIALVLRDDGYAVDLAEDGEAGLYYALNYDYDAILLDVMLPRLNGWQLLEKLRKVKKTPVLMLTALDQVGDRVRGLDAGADDYIVKPFELAELFARLRAVIRRHANHGANVLEIGSVRIDTGRRLVTKASKPVELTPREYLMVEYLALHRGKVVSRAQLYEHLADENEDSASNLFNVHVCNLRRKLGADFIVTRRGHGYCIE